MQDIIPFFLGYNLEEKNIVIALSSNKTEADKIRK